MRRRPDLQPLAKRLYERRGEAVVVPFVERALPDWRPRPGDCHRNVDWWVANNKECKAMRGWLMFGPLMQVVRFTAHSVVEEADGTLIDITPAGASQRYPFIRYEGDESNFVELIDTHKIEYVNHVIIPESSKL